MEKNGVVAKWMEKNNLSTEALAVAVGYSYGAAAKWRQGIAFPTPRAEKAIRRVQERRGWTPFPARPA